jgi:hypothetical protein
MPALYADRDAIAKGKPMTMVLTAKPAESSGRNQIEREEEPRDQSINTERLNKRHKQRGCYCSVKLQRK